MPAKKSAPRTSKAVKSRSKSAASAGKKVTTTSTPKVASKKINPREEAAIEVFALGFAILAVVFFVASLVIFR